VAKPIVNGIEQDLQGRGRVVRLNILSAIGRRVASDFDVQAVPTTLVFDGAGNVCYRHSGLPDRETVVKQVEAAQQQ
jgi:hypothetical protein